MPARIKNDEIKAIHALVATGKFFEARWMIAEILAKHGCHYDTHIITSEGWIVELPKVLKK